MATVVMAGWMAARRVAWPRGRTLLGLIAMGALGYVGQSFCYFSALQHAPAGLVALLLYLYPALVAVLAVVVLKERFTRRKTVALALALGGAVLTIGVSRGGTPLGVAFGIGAAIIYAVYIIAGTRLLERAPAIPASTVIIASAGAGLPRPHGAARPAVAGDARGLGGDRRRRVLRHGRGDRHLLRRRRADRPDQRLHALDLRAGGVGGAGRPGARGTTFPLESGRRHADPRGGGAAGAKPGTRSGHQTVSQGNPRA